VASFPSVDYALGSVRNPLSWDPVVARFADCLEVADVTYADSDIARFAENARTPEPGSLALPTFCSPATADRPPRTSQSSSSLRSGPRLHDAGAHIG
jgi:hypothetical protein